MKKIKAVLIKEWRNFVGSERGVFFIYGVLVLSWSFLPLNKDLGSGPIWWLFFSIIISGNFSNSVFVAERMNGSMEILLTSGFSRDSVFLGKTAFVVGATVSIGMACFLLSLAWTRIMGIDRPVTEAQLFQDAFLFCAGAFMNVTFGAWMSFRLQSPRIIPFLTILVMGLIVAGFACLSVFLKTPQWTLGVLLTIAAGIFGTLAKKEFHGEKVIQPIHL
jgi:ABC-type Na+ efflux pump permease subunit